MDLLDSWIYLHYIYCRKR